MADDKVAKLKSILELVQSDITRKEFVEAFRLVIKIVRDVKDTNVTEWRAIHAAIQTLTDRATGENKKDIAAFQKTLTKMLGRALKDQEQTMAFMRDKARGLKNGVDGIDGEPGVNGSPDKPEQIRNKLETLIGDERLDASAIKNLEKFIRDNPRIAGVLTATALYSLADVNIAGIVAGQSIQWDGIGWIPYTPAGSSGTPVWGEDLTPQGPGTSFTLAHTPIAGTVRLFRGGAYQSVARGDYTITGNTITLSPTLQTGEVLVVDYSY